MKDETDISHITIKSDPIYNSTGFGDINKEAQLSQT